MSLILANGTISSPRGKGTAEICPLGVGFDMRRPVLTVPARKLSYRFMAAEAYWILSGDDTVDGIVPFNAKIADFSDDGKTFFGAYGPKIAEQLPYVIDKLVEDQDSRQAGLTIWRESPPQTKDVPCTVAIFFRVRRESAITKMLDAHVFMRSSDVWLGLPYDVFNFSMLGHLVCALLRERGIQATPANLSVTAASSHLYEDQWVQAGDILSNAVRDGYIEDQAPTPPELYMSREYLMEQLSRLRETSAGDPLRWWEKTVDLDAPQ